MLPEEATGANAAARNAERVAWKKRDAKARFLIITACDEIQMEYLTVCDTAHDMWKKLSTIHEQRSSTNKVSLLEDFHGYAMEPGCTMAQHVARVQNCAFRLRDIRKEIDDDTIMAKITLPSKYRAFKTTWANVPESAQTISNLLDKLLQEEKNVLKEEQISEGLAAMVVNPAKGTRGNAENKGGNKGKQFKKAEKKGNARCFRCSEKGHFAWECPTKPKKKPAENGGASGSA